MNEQLYRAFVDEVQALESFRMAYVAEHPSTPLQPDDPDVRRLLEALALFAARSRQAALGTLNEAVELPCGTELAVRAGGDAGQGAAIFRTLAPLRLLPLSLGRVGTLLLP